MHETPNPKGWRVGAKGYVGARPSDLTREQFAELGHEQTNPVKAIRRKCLDCMGGSSTFVKECTSTNCALWPFRLGRNPFRKEISEERRAELRESGLALAAKTKSA